MSATILPQIDHLKKFNCYKKSKLYVWNFKIIAEKFGGEADIIIDGGIGGVEPSTVVNCTEGEAEIVRQGKGWLEE